MLCYDVLLDRLRINDSAKPDVVHSMSTPDLAFIGLAGPLVLFGVDEFFFGVAGDYAVKVKTVGNAVYVARAQPDASSDEEKCWQVFKVTVAVDGGITKVFANGNPGFCHSADDVENLNYVSL